MAEWDDFIFIDTETGGLNFRRHPLLEVTYAVGLNKPVTLYPADVKFSLRNECDLAALRINKFIERFTSDDDRGEWVEVPSEWDDSVHPYPARWMNIPESTEEEWETFRQALKGKIWVGANPRFDVNFIEEYFDPQPLEYHYHLFDVRAWWKGVNGSIDMKSRDD